MATTRIKLAAFAAGSALVVGGLLNNSGLY